MASGTTGSFDVTVLGGGPAGLVSALLMQRSGYKVALLDNPTNVTEKVGESMPAATNRLLQKLALPLLETPPHEPISGAQCYWAGVHEQQDGLAFLQGCDWRLNRTAFEQILSEQAHQSGVQFINQKLLHLHREGSNWKLETNNGSLLHSGFIIDASGRNAVLSRLLSTTKEKGPPLVALWASVEIDQPTHCSLTQQTLIESQADGWWYSARLPQQRLMAIFHTSAEYAAELHKQPQRWQQQLADTKLISQHIAIDHFTNAALQASNARDVKLTAYYGDSWAACGDAALSFDPLSSQGIYNALASAAMLHDALVSNDRESALQQYQQRLNQVADIYQQKRQQYYRQAYAEYQTEFWKQQLKY
jgi:flavin-dependent dehydrogenase